MSNTPNQNDHVFPNAMYETNGLSLREYFAVQIMQGMMFDQDLTFKQLAAGAVKGADALIAALNNPNPPTLPFTEGGDE